MAELNRFRRILVLWDKSPENYIAFLHFACTLITLRAARVIRIGSKPGYWLILITEFVVRPTQILDTSGI